MARTSRCRARGDQQPAADDARGRGRVASADRRETPADRVFTRWLRGHYAFHSAQMDPVRDELLEALRDIDPATGAIPLVSTVTAFADRRRIDGRGVLVAEHPAAGPLRSGPGRSRSPRAIVTFLEISPHPVLESAIKECLAAAGQTGAVFHSLRRGVDESEETGGQPGGPAHCRYARRLDGGESGQRPRSFVCRTIRGAARASGSNLTSRRGCASARLLIRYSDNASSAAPDLAAHARSVPAPLSEGSSGLGHGRCFRRPDTANWGWRSAASCCRRASRRRESRDQEGAVPTGRPIRPRFRRFTTTTIDLRDLQFRHRRRTVGTSRAQAGWRAWQARRRLASTSSRFERSA